MPARELLAGETKNSFVYPFEHLNNQNSVCKQISSLQNKLNFLDLDQVNIPNSTQRNLLSKLLQLMSFLELDLE